MEGNAVDAWAAGTGKPETEIAEAAGLSQPVVNKARHGRPITLASGARLCRAARGKLRPEQFVLTPEDAEALQFLRIHYMRRVLRRRRVGRRRA